MVRVDNWPCHFSNFLRERKGMPFQWGVNDCLMFAADTVKVLIGRDVAGKYRGYTTKEQAMDMVQSIGMIELIDDCLGKGHRNYLKASRGDVVVCKMPELTAGVIDDSGKFVAMVLEEGGLIKIPLERIWRVWSV